MKKLLLASTAIVGGALMASPAAVAGPVTSGDNYSAKISGITRMMQGWYSYDQSAGLGRGYAFQAPFSEVDFTFSAKADNGINYGFRFELRDESKGNAGIDEHYVTISGDSWGTVQMGAQDGAGDSMNVSGANVLVATKTLSGGLGARQYYGKKLGGANTNIGRWDGRVSQSGDDVKLIYFTPRFSGFQLGASWTPTTGNGGRDGLNEGSSSNNAIENLWEVGANYKGKFGDVGVIVAATYQKGDESAGAKDSVLNADGTIKAGATGGPVQDHENFTIGANVSFAGFAVGAGYNDSGDSGQAIGATADSGTLWNVGASYKTGPWGVSVGYSFGERSLGTGAGDAEATLIALGAQYSVAPGWTAMAEFVDVELDEGPGKKSNDSQALVITNQFNF